MNSVRSVRPTSAFTALLRRISVETQFTLGQSKQDISSHIGHLYAVALNYSFSQSVVPALKRSAIDHAITVKDV